VKDQAYFHERFGIITSPLFEATPLLEAAQIRVQGHKSDAMKNRVTEKRKASRIGDAPTINIRHIFFSPSLTMHQYKVVFNPGDKVVFEPAFDNLVKEIRSN